MRVYYSPDYVVDIGDHTFPTRKWGLVAERLVAGGLARPEELEDPGMPERSELLHGHSPEWVDKVLTGKGMRLADESRMELRWSPELARAHAKQVRGTYLAALDALEGGLGLHAGGGSHHAFADHGEGFCVLNDLAGALLRLKAEGRVERACVVDLDVHQGNGTAAVLRGRDGLAAFSMHQEGGYPEEKTPGTVDVPVPAGTGDEKYLKLLSAALEPFLDERRPRIVLYQAGADCWEGDFLGELALTREGLAERDRIVLEACARRAVPVAVTLGGGYAPRLEDTVELHFQTLRIAVETLSKNADV